MSWQANPMKARPVCTGYRVARIPREAGEESARLPGELRGHRFDAPELVVSSVERPLLDIGAVVLRVAVDIEPFAGAEVQDAVVAAANGLNAPEPKSWLSSECQPVPLYWRSRSGAVGEGVRCG